ncbi:hypothetical protein [Mycobacterium talmoniae]|uniref:Uncharacterized protein n=1 Tax=Mycobacterium talmoniae TaxID=1858794 RepID=A0A1S1NK91_9MYCO|nr:MULTISPECIES: hypothetical protein [Mycobacterium]OHV04289.1 hypothetical protein BKN37_10600 [Mycobacterium talmoniae]TDH57495.1 hypothetical protein E2F47_01600 [Mycobacterium eburneum]
MSDQPPPEPGEFRAKPGSARRSPQEKKRLSYDRDCRNCYGENDKSSRKAIRFHKRRVNKTNRHHDRQALQRSTGPRQPDTEDLTEQRLHARKRKKWQKGADAPLGGYVNVKLRRRRGESRYDDSTWNQRVWEYRS